MRTIYKIFLSALFAACIFTSCDNDDKYVISTPVIESAEITPTTFTFGETVTLNAVLADTDSPLSALTVEIVADNRTISVQSITVGGNKDEISVSIKVPLAVNMPDNATVGFKLILSNVLKGTAEKELTGLTGKRPYYNSLYLVTDDNNIITLRPQASSKDKYEALGLSLHRSFNYRIAQKISDNQIDYSGLVWGSVNGKISPVDNSADPIFAFAQGADYTQSFVFDSYAFTTSLEGKNFGANDLVLSAFGEQTIDGELFRTLKRTLTKNAEYTLFNDLADPIIIYNPDFFERISDSKVKFLGETREYTIYFNTYRMHVILGVDNPAYPEFLLITGGGIGYPTKVSGISKEHTWWGFGNVRNFILLRKTAENVYQGTIVFHAKDDSWVGLKPYENTSWGGEKRFDAMTFTGMKLFESADGGDWHPTADVDPDAFYRLTINWATNTVNVEKVTL
ncbi:MAG: hypothetical protein LBR84_11610 [Tannerella sp.]|jgi:hypothetical protein|nr:hypothetical protein [Tannerella sp.]